MKVVVVILFVVLVLAVFIGRSVRPASRRHEARKAQAARVRELLGKGGFSPAQALSYLRKINPYSFEELVLDGFKKAGYGVRRNRSYSGDGGVDGRVSKDGFDYLVQCKRYRGYISRQDVEDFSRVCTRVCRRGFFVHTGKTGGASRDAAGWMNNVDIVSGDRMLALVGFTDKTSNNEDK